MVEIRKGDAPINRKGGISRDIGRDLKQDLSLGHCNSYPTRTQRIGYVQSESLSVDSLVIGFDGW